MKITLQIPEDVAECLRQANKKTVDRHILEEYAIRAYQTRTLSEAQLRRLLGFATRGELDDFLADHQVPRNYMLDDLQQDRRTAEKLGM